MLEFPVFSFGIFGKDDAVTVYVDQLSSFCTFCGTFLVLNINKIPQLIKKKRFLGNAQVQPQGIDAAVPDHSGIHYLAN